MTPLTQSSLQEPATFTAKRIHDMLSRGIRHLPRLAVEGSPEATEFFAAGDAILVNEGDYWNFVLVLTDLLDLLTHIDTLTEQRDAAVREGDAARENFHTMQGSAKKLLDQRDYYMGRDKAGMEMEAELVDGEHIGSLRDCQALLETIAEGAQERDDTATWALASVMAEKVSKLRASRARQLLSQLEKGSGE